MRQQSPHESSKNDIPYVSHEDPFPPEPERKERWAMPYISDRTGKPTVFTRRPLTSAEVQYGLQSCLVADDLERLKILMKQEDEKYIGYVDASQSSRDTG